MRWVAGRGPAGPGLPGGAAPLGRHGTMVGPMRPGYVPGDSGAVALFALIFRTLGRGHDSEQRGTSLALYFA